MRLLPAKKPPKKCLKTTEKMPLNLAGVCRLNLSPSIYELSIPTVKEKTPMDSLVLIALISIVTAGITMAIGSIGPALGEGRAVSQALNSLAQQPDEARTITRTLFVGLALVESTAIYCLVVTLILLFANPYWNYFLSQAGG
jgi:F-type H+-transporting ATPase subunit c